MEAISTILAMLVMVVASGAVLRITKLPLPLPLVQIAMGAGLASVTQLGVQLNPDVFFLLFLPPLLFSDGWRIPKDGLFRDKRAILSLAFGLVIFTVLGIGWFVHWMIPSMPLTVAFALAAIISPTDPVAVSAVAARVPIPKRLMHILEGESILNDASGLVCMRFAVVAMLTGTFSLSQAGLTFVWLVVGGIASGIVVTVAVNRVTGWISSRYGEETGSEILISLLLPFSAYLLAEQIAASGILAAVAAGMTMNHTEFTGRALPATRVRRAAVWDSIQFTLNGIMFVLLGEQLPRIIGSAIGVVGETGHTDPAWLLAYVLAITLALAVLRYVWVWVSLRFTIARTVHRGGKSYRPNWRLLAATSLAGVRGAVTLAGILTLPLALQDGSPFPARDLAICLAAGVIILSLLMASMGLPFVLRGLELPPEPHHERLEDEARVAAAQAAITAVETAQHQMSAREGEAEYCADAAARIMELYRQRLDSLRPSQDDGADPDAYLRQQEIERELRRSALRAERQELYTFARQHHLSGETLTRLVREIDLLETRLSEAT